MVDKEKQLQKAIEGIEQMCPEYWDIIGRELKELAIPRDREHSHLDYAYIEKCTIVTIVEKLGFKF